MVWDFFALEPDFCELFFADGHGLACDPWCPTTDWIEEQEEGSPYVQQAMYDGYVNLAFLQEAEAVDGKCATQLAAYHLWTLSNPPGFAQGTSPAAAEYGGFPLSEPSCTLKNHFQICDLCANCIHWLDLTD